MKLTCSENPHEGLKALRIPIRGALALAITSKANSTLLSPASELKEAPALEEAPAPTGMEADAQQAPGKPCDVPVCQACSKPLVVVMDPPAGPDDSNLESMLTGLISCLF
eukprot:386060_1